MGISNIDRARRKAIRNPAQRIFRRAADLAGRSPHHAARFPPLWRARVGFEIRFSNPEQASLFEREFGLEAQLTNLSAGFVARTASHPKAAL
jgi:hypothetical protein